MSRSVIKVCDGWKFSRQAPGEAHCEQPSYSVESWESVELPHTPHIEAEVVRYPFQGICWYRRTIAPRPEWAGKRVVLEFGAGMQIADIWVGGEHRQRHLGGYLPFSVDLTDLVAHGKDALVVVRLDNRDTSECPPGKPLEHLDFSYFGGLYREAQLVVTAPLHVSDPIRANIQAGGGIFIRTEELKPESARISIQTHVVNETTEPIRRCHIVSNIFDPEGVMVQTAKSFPLIIAGGEGHHFRQEIDVASPKLWHPNTPQLYTLVTEVHADGVLSDVMETRFGIRHIAMNRQLYLNGEFFPIRGTNRHQEYPFIGNAAPPNAQRRDAQRIKDAGFNFVRLSHYPQDPSFLDACDELGLLVQAAIPGWQQFWPNNSFISCSFQDVRELIRRDRNHPSIVFWEPNLNETGVGENGLGHSDWCRTAHEITHLEYPGEQCFTFGDAYPEKPGWDWDVTGLVREYGDFAFGGNESTSRHRRKEGEAALLQQAWNYQWTLNHVNAGYADPTSDYCGCATWVMFDYNRGYHDDACTCGAMDIFRLPKYVYYLYQSQRDPRVIDDRWSSGPMTFIASDWTPRTGAAKVIVFSNCDEVELLIDGVPVSRRRPDAGPDTVYSERKETSLATVGDDYDRSGGNPYDGGNANHIPHPPFTFTEVTYRPGTLTAVGYIDGKEAARHSVSTPGEPQALEVWADMANVSPAETGLDVLIVHARIIDANGTTVPVSDRSIAFEVDGRAELIGPNPALTDAGISSILLRTSGPVEEILVTARLGDISASQRLV